MDPVDYGSEVQPNTIDYGKEEYTPTPSASTAETRGTIAAYGSGKVLNIDDSTDLSKQIANGQEGQLRQQAAAATADNSFAYKQGLLGEIAKRNGNITIDDYHRIMDDPTLKPPSPDYVFEKNYADRYMYSLSDQIKDMDSSLAPYLDSTKDNHTVGELLAAQDYQRSLLNGGDFLTGQKLMEATRDDLDDQTNQQSYIGRAFDFAKGLIPGHNEYINRNLLPGAGLVNSLSENLDEQRQTLLNASPQEKVDMLNKIKEYFSNNPSAGRDYMDSMLGTSSIQKGINNLFSLADLAGVYGGVKAIAGVGTGAVEAGRLVLAGRKALADAVETAATSKEAPAVAEAVGAGNNKEASVLKAGQDAADMIDPQQMVATTPDGSADFQNTIKSYIPNGLKHDTDIIAADDPTVLSMPLRDRLLKTFQSSLDKWQDIFANRPAVERIPLANITTDIVRQSKQNAMDLMSGVKSSIMDVSNPWWNRTTNSLHYDLKLGTIDGQLFPDVDSALQFAKEHGLNGKVFSEETKISPRSSLEPGEEGRWADDGGYVPDDATVEQRGFGYFLRVTKPIDERDSIWKDLLVATDRDRTAMLTASDANRYIKGLFAKFRTAEDTLSLTENEQRKAATYGPGKLFEPFRDEQKYINDVMNGTQRYDEFGNEIPAWKRIASTTLNKLWYPSRVQANERFDQLKRILSHAQDMEDPETGLPGYFFKKPSDIKEFYIQNFNRIPDFADYQAYFAVQRNYEYERLINNFNEYRFKSRVGTESHSVGYSNGVGKNSKTDWSPSFEGTTRTNIPATEDNVLTLGRNGKHTLKQADEYSPKDREKIADGIAQGKLKVIELYDTKAKPLNDWAKIPNDQRVKYVITDQLNTSPIDINQLNRRGGGHFDYAYNHYIKQANVSFTGRGKAYYEGDNTLMPVLNRVMGGDISGKMNKIRDLIQAEKFDEAEEVAKGLSMPWPKIKGWFTGYKDEKTGQTIPPRFNMEHDFVTVPKGKSTYDVDESLTKKYGDATFKDKTRSGDYASVFRNHYTQERDASRMFTLYNEGDAANPVYKYQPAELIDPLTMMNRGMGRIINSSFMDDYKLYAVNKWVMEAAEHLKGDLNEIKSTPFYYFHNPEYKSDIAVKEILEANRQKIQQFIRTPDKFDQYVQGWTQSLIDAAYTKYGPAENRSAVNRLFTVYGIDQLARFRDPLTAMRGMAFHYKLGLYNIPQFLVQAQAFSNILAISPRSAVPALAATMMHGWSRINKSPEVVAAMDKLLSDFNIPGFTKWKPGEFSEAMKEFDNSGYGHVGGEAAVRNNVYNKSFAQNDYRKLLDFGATFFQAGEATVRTSSYYTAFREFRELNPLKAITEPDRKWILQRADLLNNNMSRASAGGFQSSLGGLGANVGQFLTYQARLGELFWGKRLDTMAKARLVAFNAAIYGLPMSAGVTGLPITDNIREAFRKQFGYNPGEKVLSTFVNEGIPAALYAMVSGGGDIQKGTVLNVGQSYGLQGWTQIMTALNNDRPFWSLLGGASGNIMTNQLTAALGPVFSRGVSMVNGDAYPLKWQDVDNVLQDISGYSNGAKLLAAYQTGKVYSRTGIPLTDQSKFQGWVQFLTRLHDVRIDDAYADIKSGKAQKELWNEAQSKFNENMRLATQAMQNNDPDTAHDYFSRAQTELQMRNVPYEMRGQFLADANKNYGNMVDQNVISKFNVNNTPPDTRVLGVQLGKPGSNLKAKLDQAAEEYKLNQGRK